MAKVAISSIKYSITADFESEGPLQKPDVIGALFGQTEGLLGADMELRELQKEGKIGRIEVDLVTTGGKTSGEITIPSALDKTSTTIVAASLETIDKIGPTDAKITIKEIEDVRGNKRDYIMERAKQLLANVKGAEVEAQEMDQELRESARLEKITTWGEDNLPAGDISGKELIIVEGRADVVNMLKHRINNCLGMQGSKFPKSITALSAEKEVTLFVDGDRGGLLIAQNVADNATVVYIAQAPDGKEVEELTGKELHMALRKKVKADFFLKSSSRSARPTRGRFERREREEVPAAEKSTKKLTDSDRDQLQEIAEDIRGRNVLVLSEDLEVLKNVPASKLAYLRTDKPVWVLMAGTTSKGIFDGAEKLGAAYIAAKTFGKIESSDVELVSL